MSAQHAVDRMLEIWKRAPSEGAEPVIDEMRGDFRFFDHTQQVAFDRDGQAEQLRRIARSPGLRIGGAVLLRLGPRCGAGRLSYEWEGTGGTGVWSHAGSGTSAYSFVHVCDDDGLGAILEVFDPDELPAAFLRLEELYQQDGATDEEIEASRKRMAIWREQAALGGELTAERVHELAEGGPGRTALQ